MLETFKVQYVLSNSDYLIEINFCKDLISLETFCSFCKPCYGLTNIELLTKFAEVTKMEVFTKIVTN